MNYNKSERYIAFVLSKCPGLKLFIKKVYQRFNYMIYKKNYKFKSKYSIKEVVGTANESFFGYYDKSPINKTNEFIIFQSSNYNTTNLPSVKKSINLVLYDIKLDKYDIIDSLYAYNWQQGSKLMWLNDFEFIYNNYDKKANKYISKIYNIKKKSFSIIDFPIYDTFEKTFAISINFERLNIGRADYAYKNKQTKIDWNNNSDDGLYYVDLVKNKTKLLITLEDIIKLNYKETMNDAKHKFNHIMISPDGKKIMFMHRWFTKNNRRYDTLLVSNIDGSDIRIVADDDMVSHCFWYGNNNIFAYLRDENFGDKFYMINIDTAQKKIIGKDLIDKLGDGHPTIFEDNVVFDTYPNKARMKELYLLNFKTEKLEKLGEFLEPFTYYGETRCDLHPRWSFDGKKVFFDSVHTGKRKLYWIDIENE